MFSCWARYLKSNDALSRKQLGLACERGFTPNSGLPVKAVQLKAVADVKHLLGPLIKDFSRTHDVHAFRFMCLPGERAVRMWHKGWPTEPAWLGEDDKQTGFIFFKDAGKSPTPGDYMRSVGPALRKPHSGGERYIHHLTAGLLKLHLEGCLRDQEEAYADGLRDINDLDQCIWTPIPFHWEEGGALADELKRPAAEQPAPGFIDPRLEPVLHPIIAPRARPRARDMQRIDGADVLTGQCAHTPNH
jgi:hypothetical protein